MQPKARFSGKWDARKSGSLGDIREEVYITPPHSCVSQMLPCMVYGPHDSQQNEVKQNSNMVSQQLTISNKMVPGRGYLDIDLRNCLNNANPTVES